MPSPYTGGNGTCTDTRLSVAPALRAMPSAGGKCLFGGRRAVERNEKGAEHR